jgi:hypothetical protein
MANSTANGGYIPPSWRFTRIRDFLNQTDFFLWGCVGERLFGRQEGGPVSHLDRAGCFRAWSPYRAVVRRQIRRDTKHEVSSMPIAVYETLASSRLSLSGRIVVVRRERKLRNPTPRVHKYTHGR